MKAICIYHSRDLDGWMSAAIVRKWFEEKHGKIVHGEITLEGLKNKEILRSKAVSKPVPKFNAPAPAINFLGWDYGDDIPTIEGYQQVIMCDISFPPEVMQSIHEKVKGNFIWIDHHISAINSWDITNNSEITTKPIVPGYRDTSLAACELTWNFFFKDQDMPEIVRLLGRYDSFGHKGTNEEQKVLEFQYGARQCISNYKEAYEWLEHCLDYNRHHSSETPEQHIKKKGSIIYQYLCTEAKEIYKRGFTIVIETAVLEAGVILVPSKSFKVVNRPRFNPANFGIDYHSEGYDGVGCFHYEKGRWMWSLYNDNGEVDCSVIAKAQGGGGHKGAAGFIQDNLNFNLK